MWVERLLWHQLFYKAPGSEAQTQGHIYVWRLHFCLEQQRALIAQAYYITSSDILALTLSHLHVFMHSF